MRARKKEGEGGAAAANKATPQRVSQPHTPARPLSREPGTCPTGLGWREREQRGEGAGAPRASRALC